MAGRVLLKLILNKSGLRAGFGYSRLRYCPITGAVIDLHVQLVNVFYDQLNGNQIL
jgi:hypothetical protein